MSAAHTLVRSDLNQATSGKDNYAETELSHAHACQAVALRITHLSGQINRDRETSAHVFKLGKNVCPVLFFGTFEAVQKKHTILAFGCNCTAQRMVPRNISDTANL